MEERAHIAMNSTENSNAYPLCMCIHTGDKYTSGYCDSLIGHIIHKYSQYTQVIHVIYCIERIIISTCK